MESTPEDRASARGGAPGHRRGVHDSGVDPTGDAPVYWAELFELADADTPDNKPRRIGRFTIERELGRGGLGVFLAQDPVLKRPVALKVPRIEVLLSPLLRARFDREGQAAALLTHPNLATVFEVGHVGPISYIVTAYCAGPSLVEWLEEEHKRSNRWCDPRVAANIVVQLGEAIHYAHTQGVLHRDIKPSNVILGLPDPSRITEPVLSLIDTPQWVPKLVDFGLARLDGVAQHDTRSGQAMGTLGYMSPEQAEGRQMELGPKLKPEGDELKGAVEYDLEGQTGELSVSGTRPGSDLDLNGTWLLVATSDAGTFEPKLQLKHDGNEISGNYEWTESVVAEIKDGEIVDEELKFTVTHDFEGQVLKVNYKVKPDGDKLAGTADYKLGDQTGTAQIEGSRSKAASIAGYWSIAITGENGDTIEATAKLTQEGDQIGGDYSGPAGEAKITDAKLDGKTLTFQVVRERDGQKLVLSYKGEVDGDKITGDVEFDFDGQTRSTKFEAKRG